MHNPESTTLLNFGIDEPSSVIGPQSWLFHELTDLAYGVKKPRVTPTELLELGEIYVDMVNRHPVQFN